jgi:hypothetical protein
MEGEPFERVNSREFWNIRIGQDSQGCKEVGSGKVKSFVSRDIPAIASGIVVRGDDFVLEDIILEDVGFLGCVEDLHLESFRSQVASLPLGRITIVGEAIDPALSVCLSTWILIPVPGPAKGAAFSIATTFLRWSLF